MTLAQLYTLQNQLAALHGKNSADLNGTGLDNMLTNLDHIVTSVEQLRDVITDLISLDEAFQLILKLLDCAKDEPLAAIGLKNLLAPLSNNLHQQTGRFTELI